MVMSIDSSGFKDSRMSTTVVPWNAVKSMRQYLSSRYKREIGITVEVDPTFWQVLPLRLSFKLSRFANMESGASANLVTENLDVGWSEVLRVAGAYTLIKTHNWLDDVV
jgi:hypothetical protein